MSMSFLKHSTENNAQSPPLQGFSDQTGVINSMLLFRFHQSVNLLAMRTRDVVKGSHTRKTASFIRVRKITDCQHVLQSVTKWYLLSNSVSFS